MKNYVLVNYKDGINKYYPGYYENEKPVYVSEYKNALKIDSEEQAKYLCNILNEDTIYKFEVEEYYTLRDKLYSLGISNVFIEKIEYDFNRMNNGDKKGLSTEEYSIYRDYCTRLADHIIKNLDK